MIKIIKDVVVICHLRKIRQKAGFRQVTLAHRLQVRRQTIANIEKEKNLPSVKFALQLADYLDVKVEDIFQLVSDED
jgi:putative transcriptional regulator